MSPAPINLTTGRVVEARSTHLSVNTLGEVTALCLYPGVNRQHPFVTEPNIALGPICLCLLPLNSPTGGNYCWDHTTYKQQVGSYPLATPLKREWLAMYGVPVFRRVVEDASKCMHLITMVTHARTSEGSGNMSLLAG